MLRNAKDFNGRLNAFDKCRKQQFVFFGEQSAHGWPAICLTAFE